MSIFSVAYLLLDKSRIIAISHTSYLQLIHDMKLCGRTFWRHNLDMLYIRAELCDWNFTLLRPTAKGPAWWSGSCFCQPSWLSPNASTGKSDLAGWKATSTVTSLTFYTWMGRTVEKQSLHLVFPRENLKAIVFHFAMSYHSFQTLHNVGGSASPIF